MKYFLLVSIFLTISFAMAGQDCKKYHDQLEADSEIIKCEYNYTIEQLDNGSCILKRYYPENKTVTLRATFKSNAYKVKHGLFVERWDDGSLVTQGMYANDQKVGEWRENVNQIGFYRKGSKYGTWKTYNKDSTIRSEHNYVNGELHGPQIAYDTLGNKEHTEVYEYGTLVSTTRDTSAKSNDEMPLFGKCKKSLSDEELDRCSKQKLLKFIYSKLKYPKKAIKIGIQGMARVQFTIAKDGTVKDVKVLRGLCKEIKDEIEKVFDKMPKWKPAIQNGKTVNILYTMPIRFKLD